MAGGPAAGGIETLVADYAKASGNENIFIFAWGEGPSVKMIRNAGCRVEVLNGKVTGNLKMVSDSIKIINDVKPDHVIIHHATPELRFIGILVHYRYPVYIYHHSNAINEYNSKGIKRLITHIIYMISTRTAVRNLAISESVKESVHDVFGIPNEKIEVIYNGIDLKRFQRNEKHHNDIVQLAYVGRLVEGKGVQIILQALSELPKELNYRFTIVGDGVYKRELEEKAATLGIMDRVIFTGARSDVDEILRKSDVFISVPIIEEGLGNSVIEAMACGLVCVCSDSGGLKELVDDRKNGYLVKMNDVDSLSNILEELITEYPSCKTDNIENEARKKAKLFDIAGYSLAIDELE